jgi:CRISPR type I-E-associated protein CasA/Cse1
MALGETLFETLALNLTQYGAEHTIWPTVRDAPAWEQDDPHVPKKDGHDDKDGTRPRGPIDHLTWLSRRVKLLAGDDPLRVTGVQFAQNLKPHVETLDPFKSFSKSKEQGWVARRLDPDRAVWRDSHAIFQQSDDDSRRPVLFNWLAQIDEAQEDGEIQAQPAYAITVAGLARNPRNAADVLLWRHERFTVPLAYLHSPTLLGKLESALGLAEEIGRLLRPGRTEINVNDKKVSVPRPFQTLAEAFLPSPDGRPDRKRVDALIEHLAPERRFWAGLEVPFRTLLADLAGDRPEAAQEAWAVVLQRTAWAAFREATSGLDRTARALEGVACAERELGRRLHHTLGNHLPRPKGVTA